MFSCNQHISMMQLRKMVVTTVLFSGFIYIPHFLTKLFGRHVTLGSLFFLFMGSIFVIYIWQMSRQKGEATPFIWTVQMVRLFVRTFFYSLFTIEILRQAKVPFMSIEQGSSLRDVFLFLPFLLLGIYGANISYVKRTENAEKEGHYIAIEKQARFRELQYHILYLPYIIMLVLGVKEIDLSYLFSGSFALKGRYFIYAYALLTFILPMENMIWLKPYVKIREMEKQKKTSENFYVLWGSFFVILLVSLFVIGIYGVNGSAQEEIVSMSIMRYIPFPFGVLERFDCILDWYFIVGIFALICENLFLIGEFFSNLWKVENRLWILVITGMCLLFLMYWFIPCSNVQILYLYFGVFVDIPLALILPWLRKRR